MWSKLSALNRLLATDLEHQLFYFRKLCSCLPIICGTLHVWTALLKCAASAGASLFFLLSPRAGARCARRIVGGVYRNALHACVVAEIVRTPVSIASFAQHEERVGQQREFAMQIADRLTTALLNMTVSASMPPSLLASHLVMCLSNVIVDVFCQSLKHLAEPVLRDLLAQLNGLYGRLRLASYSLCRPCISEEECHDEVDGSLWCVADVQPDAAPFDPHE